MNPTDNKPTDNKPTAETKADAVTRITNRALANVSTHNIAFAVRTLEQRTNAGIRPASNYAYLLGLIRFDRHLGRPFDTTTPEDVSALLGAYRQDHSLSSLKTLSLYVQAILKDAFKLRETKDMPYEFRQVLKVARPKLNVRGAVIPERDFLAALDAIPGYIERSSQAPAYAHELIQAFLWLLWDSGMRISEALSLCISDVTFDEGTKTAKLSLREEKTVSHGLKTGARYVIVRDAVPALKAWISVHPGRLDPESPLLVALAYFTHVRGLNSDSANYLIRDLFALVGAKPTGSRKHYSCHDFRHTAATRDARHGYREAALRLKYGWSATSPMPAHYVHLSEEDARARVLATPSTGATTPPRMETQAGLPAGMDLVNLLAAQLARAMASQAV
ncbi:MAG: tyrosine-type recombinase/integrase [Thermoplasmatota archaeon]